METMISLERAWEIVSQKIQPIKTEKVNLHEAYHRILAESVTSSIDMPPFDRSPLDGYTYVASPSDLMAITLRQVSEIPAGVYPDRDLVQGECAKIFTGAPIPQGANCVVRMEDTESQDDQVLIRQPVLPGANIVHQGEEIQKGEIILTPGSVLDPASIGLLAALGVEEVTVYRRPRIGLLSTGSELMEVGQPLLPGKIYNSNTYTLRGLLMEAGCEVKVASFVPDRLPETIETLESFKDMDAVVTTGGASVGDYDLVREAFVGMGCELLFWKLNLKPGTPAAVGIKQNQLYFSLSGNPAAAMITYELLVRPALKKMAGCLDQEEVFPVKMAGSFGKSGKQRRFLRARAVLREGEIWADPNYAQGSGILRSMAGSNLLVDVPGGHGPVKEGEMLFARWIPSEGE
ncbi:molybdopterin molybdotransferase MoeA [Desulfitobacterium metallireducens]|uniref:Molybdopterin molybdenumtransferase n=1 Tax=Desulfitobacterium metallireducens DSM 15288 TaxID=871968 RepID=W0EA75_9FIRM|nr:gephyrin-like molybdotransferase Glp [Desulfitobacterium metallireducens]AHF07750.1 molybdenum cofactor biosynthesis protein MoeA [Desulfitobacterium metallireducens DSM 15288]